MKIILFLSCLTTIVLANPADQGVSLIYQGKNEEALKVLEPLAQHDNPKAAFFMSQILLFGDKPNITKGMVLLEKAVSSGYGPALDTYAGLYLHGDILPQDLHKAKMYYEIAAQRGYGPSQFNYGVMCKNGDKVPLDLESAYVYLSLAADNQADLGDVTIDATEFRNQVRQQLSQEALDRVQKIYHQYKNEISHKKISNDRCH